jgi:hypothetical protein
MIDRLVVNLSMAASLFMTADAPEVEWEPCAVAPGTQSLLPEGCVERQMRCPLAVKHLLATS